MLKFPIKRMTFFYTQKYKICQIRLKKSDDIYIIITLIMKCKKINNDHVNNKSKDSFFSHFVIILKLFYIDK